MQRPPSIVRYEQLYLAAFVLGLAVTALGWSQSVATFAANPLLADKGWLLSATTVFGIAVRVLLWYFTARQPSVVAKWIVVVFALLAVIGIVTGLLALAAGHGAAVLQAAASIGSSALYIAAAALLFRPDARTWFGEDGFADRERGE